MKPFPFALCLVDILRELNDLLVTKLAKLFMIFLVNSMLQDVLDFRLFFDRGHSMAIWIADDSISLL